MGNDQGMGVNGIWDIIVLVIVARMFGFGGNNNGALGDGVTTAAVTEAQIERAIRASQDNSNIQTALAAIAAKAAECCCENKILTITTANDTNRHLDQQTFGLTEQANVNTQRLIDRIDALEDHIREQRINELETQVGQYATRDIVGSMINPVVAALSGVQAQLNCGVKAISYTPSVPVVGPYAYDNVPFYNNFCGWGNQGYPFK